MRMGTFLLGGVVGAFCAMYISRNKPMLLKGMNMDQTMDKVGQIARTAKQMWEDTAAVPSNPAPPEQPAPEEQPAPPN